jgi:hypothetical protein
MIARARRFIIEPLRLLIGRAWWLIAYGSTLWTRAGLAWCSTLWAVGLWLPGETLSRPVYRYMAICFGEQSEFIWASLFTVHSLGMWWRTFSSKPSMNLALTINLLGVALFCFAAFSILATLTHPFPAAVAADLACAFAAILVAIRTHVNPEGGWKSD